jgi:hypothetical protein
MTGVGGCCAEGARPPAAPASPATTSREYVNRMADGLERGFLSTLFGLIDATTDQAFSRPAGA